ncbi:MAG: methyltransferase domain-containing protein [Gammaproteobacteria bacterium]|nr:methyltransferase domain-containing protein [Gammaproteobacteria bacterium]
MTELGEKLSGAEERRRLRSWYEGRLGQLLLECERRELDEVLANLFGYYLLQVGAMMDAYLLESSRIRHQFVMDNAWPMEPCQALPEQVICLCGQPQRLPVLSDSVDVVLLPHTLEFAPSAHEVLREAERVLVAEGHVVILGFNPWSVWGIWRLLRWRRRQHAPWHGTFRGVYRIKDWLSLLGFDIVQVRPYFFRPPLQHETSMRRLEWIERLGRRWWPVLGGAYLMVAKKRVTRLTPIKPRWRPRRSLLQPDVPKPTV